jgi:aspartyl-tRNA(Asn)/glutamyl-tRNA(Gln) amidotransferase subunit A
MTDLPDLRLCEAKTGLDRGDFTAVDLVRACLGRIDGRQSELNAFIDIRADEAVAAARNVDDRRRRGESAGPLAGIPLAHKDMFFRQGRISTCGSKILRDRRATTTATALERLDAAGAIDLGTLNMSEFALGPTGHNFHFGPCRNPHDPDRVPGGSSSGAGAAVGSAMAFGALGSDTAGSVRLPASLCGIVGLKPTIGRVSGYGTMPLSRSLDTVGVLARGVLDCALIFDAIAGHDRRDRVSSRSAVSPCAASAVAGDLAGVRIGRPLDHYFEGVHGDVGRVVEAAIARLADLGAEVVDLPMPHHEPVAEATTIIITSEAAALHSFWLETRPEDYGRPVRERIESGFSHPAPRYLQIVSDRTRRVRMFGEHMRQRCDVFVAPVLDLPAPTVAETDTGGGPAALDLVSRLNRKTRTINYLGFPSIAVPAGRDANGMPVGIQFVGLPFAEPLLFRIAAAFEAASTPDSR